MAEVALRKALAGSDSFGHRWPEDGAVVRVPHEQAEQLLALADGGFSIAHDTPAAEHDGDDEEPAKPSPRRRPAHKE